MSLSENVATVLHFGQVDKAGVDYIEHPRRVARLVRELYPDAPEWTEDVAWLHDTIEDCGEETAFKTIAGVGISPETWALVALLSRNIRPDIDYYERIRNIPVALMVKHADILDNLDPERLALLDEKTQTRLRQKYAKALDALGLPAYGGG